MVCNMAETKNKRGIKYPDTKTERRRLTPKEKRRCVAAYLHYGTYERAARECDVSIGTIKNCVKADPDFVDKYNEKRRQEMEELFGALSVKSKKFAKYCDMFLDHLSSDAMKAFIAADPAKAATIFGITLDKFIVVNRAKDDTMTDGNITINVIRKTVRQGEENNPVNMDDDEVL